MLDNNFYPQTAEGNICQTLLATVHLSIHSCDILLYIMHMNNHENQWPDNATDLNNHKNCWLDTAAVFIQSTETVIITEISELTKFN